MTLPPFIRALKDSERLLSTEATALIAEALRLKEQFLGLYDGIGGNTVPPIPYVFNGREVLLHWIEEHPLPEALRGQAISKSQIDNISCPLALLSYDGSERKETDIWYFYVMLESVRFSFRGNIYEMLMAPYAMRSQNATDTDNTAHFQEPPSED